MLCHRVAWAACCAARGASSVHARDGVRCMGSGAARSWYRFASATVAVQAEQGGPPPHHQHHAERGVTQDAEGISLMKEEHDTTQVAPSELLRTAKLRKEEGHARSDNERTLRPPVCKSIFFLDEGADNGACARAADVEDGQTNRSQVGGEAATTPSASTPFLSKLHKMSEGLNVSSSPTYDEVAEERHRRLDSKIKAERSRMLIFRDVGMDLDKPILSRDVFLIFKYLRYGVQFAVDNELERMLRYFNEHALHELKIIQGSKLIRGPAFLSRNSRAASRPSPSASGTWDGTSYTSAVCGAREVTEGVPRFASSHFPRLTCTALSHYCDTPPAHVTAELAALLPQLTQGVCSLKGSHGELERTTGGMGSGGKATATACPSVQQPAKAVYSTASKGLWMSLSARSFRRPAVVIFSQLGQKLGSTADVEWRRLAFGSICPQLMPHFPDAPDAPRAAKTGWKCGVKGAAPSAMPIDVISLRSADLYKYERIHRLYVHRLAKSLSGGSSEVRAHPLFCALSCSTTFVGTRMLEPFYHTFALRNYLSPHVFLVDHEGDVRWLSGGCPDEHDKKHFPSLLRQLTQEYHRSRL